ncbi:MAG: hypothetical protein AAGA30_17910 [Planctomycetota bacterium]
MRRTNLSLGYKSLEPRLLLAGDVTVMLDGDLVVTGDELSNQVQIVANDNGEVTVIGLNNTTINGDSAPFIVEGVIDLKGARGRNAAFDGGLKVNLNDGHDRIDIKGVEFSSHSRIATGEGNDFVRILRNTWHEPLEAFTNDGHDTFLFVQSRAKAEFSVATADGGDNVEIRNSRVWHNTDLNTGKGHDDVLVKRTRLTGLDHQLETRSGNDRVELVRNRVNQHGLNVETGNGNDRVTAMLEETDAVEGLINLHGQNGSDALSMNIDEAFAQMVETDGFEQDAQSVLYDNTGPIDELIGNNALGGPGGEILATILTADFFELETATSISSIEWRGTAFSSEINETPDFDNFTIEIFENVVFEDHPRIGTYNAPAAQPSIVLDIGNDVTRTDTGETWERDGSGLSIYRFSAEVDLQLDADKIYWISIFGNSNVDPTANFSDYSFSWALQSTGQFDVDNAASTDYGDGNWFTHIPGRFDFVLRS